MTIKESVRAKIINLQDAVTSWESFKTYLEAPKTELDEHGVIVHRDTTGWSNEDLDPTPPEKRTWTWVNYVTFYWGLSFGNWTLGSTMVGIGLNWWESILVIFASQFISSIAMFFNSRCASVYHIGYPVVARSVFGMWGSFYVVAARAMLAIIWYGVQVRRERISHTAAFRPKLTSQPNSPALLRRVLCGSDPQVHLR